MRLVQGFAVVCISTASHFITTAESHLHKPIRIGERLARHADDVSLAQPQDLFRLLKRRYAAGGNDWRAKAALVHGFLNRRNERDAAPEWASRVGEHSGHALVTTLTRVRINSLAHLRLLRVFKFAAFRKRQKIKARSGKLLRIKDRIFDATAARNHLISQKPHTHNVIVSNMTAHLAINLERQTHSILSRATVSIRTIVLRAQKPGHCVSMRVVKLDSIKPGLTRPLSGRSEDRRQLLRQIPNVFQVHVGYALAITKA